MFKFKATSANVIVRLQTGTDKDTLTNETLHLTDENTILKCISAINFEEAVLNYSSLQKGFWYYISVRGTAGSFTLCVDGGTEASQVCECIYCDSEGNVGIGTPFSANGYKLSVHGKIMAEGVKVELQSKWLDYVFEKDYRLLTLSELKEYIEKNGHLPNLPSAEKTRSEGIDVGEMNVLLVEKIEELTLYIIQLEERFKKGGEKKLESGTD